MSYYWNLYKHRYQAFKEAYDYMSGLPPDWDRSEYEEEEECCDNPYLDDELYQKVFLLYLLATLRYEL